MTHVWGIAYIVAGIKSATHISAALVILWYFYRIANGQFSLL
jgi:hypothetical protein